MIPFILFIKINNVIILIYKKELQKATSFDSNRRMVKKKKRLIKLIFFSQYIRFIYSINKID